MLFAADHRANHLVAPRFVGSGEEELLRPRLEEQVPTVHPGPVLGSQQGKAMNRTIAIPRFAPGRRHASHYLSARLDGDLRSALSSNLVTAVAVGSDLDDAGLRAGSRHRSENRAGGHDPHQHTTDFG